jgi:hypothetical protein
MNELLYTVRIKAFEIACKYYFDGDKTMFYDLKKQFPYVYHEMIKDDGTIILYMFKNRNLDVKWYSNRRVHLCRDWDNNMYLKEIE